MIRGIYTAASGMIANTLAEDTRASNLANISTTGFKRNSLNFQGFPEMLIRKFTQGESQVIGTVTTGSKVRETVIAFGQGQLQETGNPFDLALEGDGFFALTKDTTPGAETLYSRAGNFTMNADGYLTTTSGHFVQGKLGPILLTMDQGPYTISPKGELRGKNGVIDTLDIATFENNNMLQKLSETMFIAREGAQRLPEPKLDEAVPYKVYQGFLELSNTNPISELVHSIEGMRHYESLQRTIKMQNDTLGKAVNEVGRAR